MCSWNPGEIGNHTFSKAKSSVKDVGTVFEWKKSTLKGWHFWGIVMERQGRINTSLPNLEHMITKMKMRQTLHSQKIFLFVLQVVCSQS